MVFNHADKFLFDLCVSKRAIPFHFGVDYDLAQHAAIGHMGKLGPVIVDFDSQHVSDGLHVETRIALL